MTIFQNGREVGSFSMLNNSQLHDFEENQRRDLSVSGQIPPLMWIVRAGAYLTELPEQLLRLAF